MLYKFKTGDKVKLRSDLSHIPNELKGAKGIISRCYTQYPTQCYNINLNPSVKGWKRAFCLETDLLADQQTDYKFKIGDKVVFRPDLPTILKDFKGAKAQIVAHREDLEYKYEIRLESGGKVLWCKEDDLSPIWKISSTQLTECICSTPDLMVRGCKCGWLQIEKQSKSIV